MKYKRSSNISFLPLQVLSFFSARLENADKNVSVPEVQEIIRQGALQFKRDRLKVSFINCDSSNCILYSIFSQWEWHCT